MARRPTLKDVAREAGVSIATVNRVVAGADGVRGDTASKVATAAARIGYHASNLLEQTTATQLPVIRLGVVLHKEKQAFYQSFARQLTRAAAECRDFRVQIQTVFSASQAPGDIAEHLNRMIGRVDAVAATAVNHHKVTDAVTRLRDAGIPCFSLLSDFAQGVRSCYFGLNNLKVGRGAAKMLASVSRSPGMIALFVGGNRWHGHEMREMGFRLQFRETGQRFELLDTLVNLETRQLTYEATLDLISRHPRLVGLYLAGGGMEGAIAALREETKPGQIALVVNEETPESLAAMADGYVNLIIGTPLRTMCDRLVVAAAEARLPGRTNGVGQVFFDPKLRLPEFI